MGAQWAQEVIPVYEIVYYGMLSETMDFENPDFLAELCFSNAYYLSFYDGRLLIGSVLAAYEARFQLDLYSIHLELCYKWFAKGKLKEPSPSIICGQAFTPAADMYTSFINHWQDVCFYQRIQRNWFYISVD